MCGSTWPGAVEAGLPAGAAVPWRFVSGIPEAPAEGFFSHRSPSVTVKRPSTFHSPATPWERLKIQASILPTQVSPKKPFGG